jgi:acyl-CoA dehydrogenase
VDWSGGSTGFERGRVPEKIGQHGQDTRELFFSDIRVPAANLLGDKEGLGFYRLMITSLYAGLAESALLEAIRYTNHRETFGRPLINFQHIRFELEQPTTASSSTSTAITNRLSRRWPN